MKITSVDVIMLKQIGRRPVFCRINTDEGIYGYGESGVVVGVGMSAVAEVVKDLAPVVLGMDPMENEVIWEKLRRSSYWGLSHNIILMAAISAMDVALWDVKAKACGLPLYKLLGGKQRDKLRAYASQVHFGWGVDQSAPGCPKTGSPEWFYQASKNAVAEGYTAIKTGISFHDENGERMSSLYMNGRLPQPLVKLAEERLAATREAIGPDVDVILESHSLTDGVSCIQIARMAEKYDIFFIEEATAPLNPEVMRRIAAGTSIPLATGERTYNRWGFLPFLENGSLSVLQPDLGTCGGITEAKKICDLAQIYDVSVQMHLPMTPVNYAASLHLEAAIPNFAIHEHHIESTKPGFIAMCTFDCQPKGGYIAPPELPGIGQELSESALAQASIETIK
ncbi:MAG: mandelate racemase/muconate lactonizing enzyme family protein [Clostridiales bacterium]|nr:mandelate racemase/muconate lactonizing enzyme family protein [Clostridiales bacterium]